MAGVPSDRPVADEASQSLVVIHLKTAAATRRLGQRLGALLQPGDVLGLDGPLGAGKTCLVQGLARGLGVPPEVAVSSPTFTLVNQYVGQYFGQYLGQPAGQASAPVAAALLPLTLYHVDLYRLESPRELDELGLWEAAESGGVMAVEWLARFPQALPVDRLELTLDILPDGGRSLGLRPGGPRAAARLAALRNALRTPHARR
ncbi:MAG TPA: tRNA (adenosine(37)-N6)-threonylcarbamoyltransferase complex ATPase subunit type 1 TsaE [Pseudomonadota bacterium]|nr:tRNA (adenosine(37)-N6)-threonylcarbamoyltransferase complex ATPase subunit type 1 TsaE [Pseudomonadota bacterium]